MVGDEGTVEWSDDDAVKSGSNTEGDICDDNPPSRKEDRKKFKTPITTLNMKDDPISTILNKIDAEISTLSRSQSSAGTGSTVIHRPSSRSRSPNRHDEEWTRSQLDRPGPMKATHTFDTSFSSKGRDSPMLNGDLRINGRADIYSDAATHDTEDTQSRKGTSDLDSVSAHDVDEKFKQILRYQDSSRAALTSDTDTVKTEDFNRKFQDSLVFSSGFKEEEQANEERDKNPQQNTPDHKSFIDRLRPKRSKSSPPIYNKPTNNHQLSPYQSLRKPTYVSDAESVRTEDFEFRFKDLIVNQMDSETDFTDNDPLHAKVKEILQVTLPYRKNERERTQSETDIRLRDRRKEMFNGGHASPRETDNRWRDRQNERINGEVQSSPRETDNRWRDRQKDRINGEVQSSPRETDNRWRDRQKERINGEAQSSPRETDNRWRDRQKEVINGDQPSSREISNKSSSSHNSRRDSLDDERQEIERESERIQREIEMERRAQSFSPRRTTKSPTRGMLSITGELPKSTSYNDLSGNEGRNSPRDSTSSQSRTSSLLERARTGLFQDRFSPSHEASSPDSLGRSRSSSSSDRKHSTGVHGSPERSSFLHDKFSTSTPNRNSSAGNIPPRDQGRNGVNTEWASPVLSNLSSPRYTSSQNGQNSPRNGDDRLSVSFQDLPNSPNQSPSKYSDSNKTSTYIDNLASEPKRTVTSYRSTSLDRDKPREGLVSAFKGSRSEVKEAEKKLQLIKAQTDEAKSQLMLTELRRENIIKDVDRIEEDLSRKKRQVKNYEDQLRSRLGDIRASDSFIDQDEKMTSLEEENASLKVRLRHMDGLELERDELVRQLDSAKEDLFNEQRQSRNKVEELQEEVENLTAQLEEYKMGPGHGQSSGTTLQFQKLEDKLHRLEKEKNDISQDKNRLLEELQHVSRSPRSDSSRQLSNREVEELRSEVSNLHSKIGACQKEINNKEDIIGRLKQQNQDVQQMYNKEKGHKEGIMEDHKRSLQTLRKEMDSAMVQMRENMFLEKQKSLEDLRSTLEREKREALARAEEKIMHQVKSQSNAIKEKDKELSSMIELVKKLEEDRKQVEKRVKDESQKQIDDLVKKERLKLEADLEWRLHKEKDQFQQEFKVKFNAVSKDLEEEKKVKDTLLAQIEKLTTELETQRLQNRQAVHDRMLAVARAKESLRQDMQVDMEKVRSKMKEDFQQEIDKLQDTIRLQEEEIKQLRSERADVLKIAKDNQQSERVERTIVNEINEECRKNSNVLGINPRKVNMTEFRENGYNSSSSRFRTPTTAALMVSGRFEDSESDIVQSVKTQLEREKTYELDKLKDKFVKGNPPNGYKPGYHNDTRMQYTKTSPYEYGPRTTAQEQELERLEREIKRLTTNQQQPTRCYNSYVEDDISTTKMINNLRNKVAELEQENSNLSKYSYSVPDLSNPIYYRRTMRSPSPTPQQERIVNILEQRAKEGDMESDTMLDQQQRSRNMMSQKMAEMTKLQNSLTTQTKDLIHLGQAYSKLNNSYRYSKT